MKLAQQYLIGHQLVVIQDLVVIVTSQAEALLWLIESTAMGYEATRTLGRI